MRIELTGVNLPGAGFCRTDGSAMSNVHVGIQLGTDPAELVRGDTAEASWVTEVTTVETGGPVDFRGPAVQGKRGDRFLYLTWVEVHPGDRLERFRRAKLMLNRIDPGVLGTALDGGRLLALVDLTGPDGGPRCARVDPPAITWSAGA